jgi:hypothetical protein
MKSNIIFGLCVMIFMYGCNPRVVTVVKHPYPAINQEETVTVYRYPKDVPADSEALGAISATDDGFTTRCDSVSVINLLKDESKKMGGNAFVITEYEYPSFWGSTCHQITGTALKVYDFNSPTITELGDSARLSDLQIIPAGRKMPRFVFSAYSGYGKRTAPLNPELTNFQKVYYQGLMSGLVSDLSAIYYYNDVGGVGLCYSGLNLWQNMYASGNSYNGHYTEGNWITYQNIYFIGLTYNARWFSSNYKFVISANIGLGYLGFYQWEHFADWIKKINGGTFGTLFELGASYQISKNWALGLKFTGIPGFIDSWTQSINGGYEITMTEPNKGEGLSNIKLSLGLHYFIW